MSENPPILPTPHLDKLNALSNNPRLPDADKIKLPGVIERYNEWIKSLADVRHAEEGNPSVDNVLRRGHF